MPFITNTEDINYGIFKVIDNSYLDSHCLPKKALVRVLEYTRDDTLIVQQLQFNKEVYTPKIEIHRKEYPCFRKKTVTIGSKEIEISKWIVKQFPLRRSDAVTVDATVGYTLSGVNLIYNNQWSSRFVNNRAYIFASRAPDLQYSIPIFPIVALDCKQDDNNLKFMLMVLFIL